MPTQCIEWMVAAGDSMWTRLSPVRNLEASVGPTRPPSDMPLPGLEEGQDAGDGAVARDAGVDSHRIVGVKELLEPVRDEAERLYATPCSAHGRRAILRRRQRSSRGEGLQGLWWVYRPSKAVQRSRMDSLSRPRTTVNKRYGATTGWRFTDQAERHGQELPGPGEYDARFYHRVRSPEPSVTSRGRTDVDLRIYYSRHTPGPAAYRSEDDVRCKVPGGGFSESRPKSTLEWVQYYAKDLPGPSDYDTVSTCLSEVSGGRFNLSNAKSDIEWTIHHSQRIPGPGAYNTRESVSPYGGRFNTGRSKTALEWEIVRAKQVPGVGAYRLPDIAAERCRSPVGKWGEGRPKSDIDWQIYHACAIPGPGAYTPHMPGLFDGPKCRSNTTVSVPTHRSTSSVTSSLTYRSAKSRPGTKGSVRKLGTDSFSHDMSSLGDSIATQSVTASILGLNSGTQTVRPAAVRGNKERASRVVVTGA